MRFDDPAHLRRLILRIMLGALAASAALAILGVLGTGFDQSTRMVGTGIAAALASGLMLATCKLLDSEKWRRAGLFLLGVLLAQFILVLISIWNPLSSNGRRYPTDEEFGLTALVFPVCALPSVLFIYIRQFRGGRLAGLLGLATCAITYAIFLRAIWSESFSSRYRLEESYWETGWTCWFFGLAAAASAAGIGLNRRYWRALGLVACVGALVMAMRSIWHANNEQKNALIISITVAILVGHANVMWLCKLKRNQEWLRVVTFIFACIGAFFFDFAGIREVTDDMTWRVGTAAGICAGCGTVAIAILTAFNRRSMPIAEDNVAAKELELVCPECSKKQNVAIKDGIGESACLGCGMIFSIRLRPPRCTVCSYILLMNRSDRCPECGTPIAAPLSPIAATI